MGMTTRIARWCAVHPWRTLCAWLVAAVVSIVLAGALLADSLTTESNFVGTPESQRACSRRCRGAAVHSWTSSCR